MSIKIGLNIHKDISKQIISDIKKLTKTDVLVGIPAQGNSREDGMNNAAIGYINETGDPERNLPARPFLVPGVDSVKDDIAKQLRKAAEASLDGRNEAVLDRLDEAGNRAVDAVKSTIVNGEFAPLSERTKADRAKRGQDFKPLFDTGELYRSIKHVVRKKGQK
ncbi:hypothetical protein M8994_18395 [Brucella sp. 21LCYQ03]|nr:hypothetical protein [Brucella sp. 21LCYQ03]